MSLTPGSHLGPYEVLSPLGAGGMGEVYRAHDPRLGREVAIKVLREDSTTDPDRQARFAQEAKAAGALNHPNVLVVFDTGEHEGAPFVVFELLEGETLRARLASKALSPPKALEYAIQIARGLAAAHEKGIVHRDLKPENLFLTREGRIKILDFGLAKLRPPLDTGAVGIETRTATVMTGARDILGTVGYMSPEQVRRSPSDHRSDIFSLGSILYEMLAGRRPFRCETEAETMAAILNVEPPALAEGNGKVPPALERIVRHCLEKRPEDRFQSARDLVFDLESLAAAPSDWPPSAATAAITRRAEKRRRNVLFAGVAAIVAGTLGAGYYRLLPQKAAPPPTFKQLTFRRGVVFEARFAPDGHTIVYGAGWEGNPSQVYSARLEGPESSPLGLPDGAPVSISSSGELAILTGRIYTLGMPPRTLARVPLAGGAPREVAENVLWADWAPDGRNLAVIRLDIGGATPAEATMKQWGSRKFQLEFPIGRVLYDGGSSAMANPRVSPDGGQVAFVEYGSDGISLKVVDLNGRATTLLSRQPQPLGLAWSPKGDEIWFADGWAGALWAVSLEGQRRLLARFPGTLGLNDISRDGRVLLTLSHLHASLLVRPPGHAEERDLSWFDSSHPVALSPDGATLLFTDRGGTYLRRTDGSPAVRLGEGVAQALSPDGRWVLLLLPGHPGKLVMLPTGPGEPRPIPLGDISCQRADLLPDGKTILVWGSAPGQGWRVFVQDLDGRGRRALTPDWFHLFPYGSTFSPDGKRVAIAGPGQKLMLIPIEGGEPRPVPGVQSEEAPVGWSADQRFVYVSGSPFDLPGKIHRIDLATGRRELWKEIKPSDPAGFIGFGTITFTPDQKAYAYALDRFFCTLYLVEGLK